MDMCYNDNTTISNPIEKSIPIMIISENFNKSTLCENFPQNAFITHFAENILINICFILLHSKCERNEVLCQKRI